MIHPDLRTGARHLGRFVVALAPLVASCDARNDASNPAFPNGGLLLTAVPLADDALASIEGLYAAVPNGDVLDGPVVAKVSPRTVSLLFGVDASYAILHAGCREGGTQAVFEGYWRHALGSERGLMRLFVESPADAASLCGRTTTAQEPAGFALVGAVGNGDDIPHVRVRLALERPLTPFRGHFAAVGHRGGCFPQFDCGASGNTVETIRLAQALAADAIEIDVRLTKDGVPILYHDPMFDHYLTRGRDCVGKIADTTFAVMRANCRMAMGEPIPTLEEALRAAVDDTTLTAVYLDIKDAAVVPDAVTLARTYTDLGRRGGRPFTVLVGLTTEEVEQAFVRVAPPGTPCLVEYSVDVALQLGCAVYSPTYTAGPHPEDVRRIQDAGGFAFFWTINTPEIVDEFLRVARPNGIVTDRPALVFYRYQVLDLGAPPGGPAAGALR